MVFATSALTGLFFGLLAQLEQFGLSGQLTNYASSAIDAVGISRPLMAWGRRALAADGLWRRAW